MNNKTGLTTIEIEPKGPAQRSIIWLHGLGADGNDFVPIIPELKLPESLNLRFIFPNAPVIPVTINNGYQMPAWFDIYGIGGDSKIDTQGVEHSISGLEELIEREIERGVPSGDIILAGFSQGAVIALMTGLTCDKPLGGIIALSGFLPMADATLAKASPANKHIPIFMAHGSLDPLVPQMLGMAAYSRLSEAGYPVSWHSHVMAHSVCAEEIRDLSKWILLKYKRRADGD